MIAAYVSGHGFGHATRTGTVLGALRARAPELPLAVVSSAPERLFRAAVPGDFEYRAAECDVGVAQRDALTLDEAATLGRWREHAAAYPRLVEREARWLAGHGASLVLGDVPPLAFAAAARAGVPAVALANFSWDWIYRHLSRTEPGLAAAAEAAAADYARASLLLRLPFAGDLSVFPRVEDVPLVARRPRLARAQARERLGADSRPLVLMSFGGIGLPGFDPGVLARLTGYRFLLSEGAGALPGNARRVGAADLERAGLGYAELVAAADAAVTKPGYGIVCDAIAAGTRLVYTERGDFPEYPILADQMRRFLPCAHVSNDELRGGRIGQALETVLAARMPPPPDLSGADVVATRLLGMAGASPA